MQVQLQALNKGSEADACAEGGECNCWACILSMQGGQSKSPLGMLDRDGSTEMGCLKARHHIESRRFLTLHDGQIGAA
eukprot:1157594-Pelagomonas_calceolata.AAC.2